jgi:(2S)-methylsuccinyl-CoA dehydrogenase
MTTTFSSELQTAATVISTARDMVNTAITTLKTNGGPDVQQVLAYDIAHVSAAVETAASLLDYGAKGDQEAQITCAFTADMVHDFATRLVGREKLWGVRASQLSMADDFVERFRAPEFLASLADMQGPRHLDDDFEMVQDTFRSFANKVVSPKAEHVHRYNEDVPEEIISGLAEIGAFGLSVPSEYGGFSEGGEGCHVHHLVLVDP